MRFMLVGTGFGATHLAWLSECPQASVEVLCHERNAWRARNLAARFGVPRTATDPIAVIGGGGIDAVAVVSPPATHESIVTAAVAAGLLVVVDKPLARDVEAAARLAGLAARTRARAYVVFQWRHNPAFARLRELCADGRLGGIVRLDLDFHHDFLAGPGTAWPWRHRGGDPGAGALSDQGVHLFDLVRWLAPGDWRVSAAAGSVVWASRTGPSGPVDCAAEDTAEVLLRDGAGPAQARVAVSRVSPGYRRLRAVVQGTGGLAELSADPADGGAVLRVFSGTDAPETVESGPHPMNPYPLILQGAAPHAHGVADFADGHAAQALQEQASREVRHGTGGPVHNEPVMSDQ